MTDKKKNISSGLSDAIPVKLFGPCKRTQHCWPTTRNIVGPKCCVRLHATTTMLALVVCSFKPVNLLGPCKRTQHCWPKNPQEHATINVVTCCIRLQGPLFARQQIGLNQMRVFEQGLMRSQFGSKAVNDNKCSSR